MGYKNLDIRIKTSWRIARIITFAVLAAVIGVTVIILSFQSFFSEIGIFVYLISGGILLFLLLTVILYPEIEYRQWKYKITEDKIEIRHGIFFLTTSVIPIIRIQHISVSRGPINRKFGLASLLIHTASGVFTIEGLSVETCDELSESLKSKLYHRLSV